MRRGPFDFNGDGEMDAFERATEFAFLNDLLNDEDAKDVDSLDDLDSGDNWDE